MKFNMDIKTRDEIIFGDYEPQKYFGGVRRFENMTRDKLQKLVDMGFANPDGAQNCSPTIESFLEFTEDKPDYVFHGYAVSDTRNDYCVSIDAIEYIGKIDDLDTLKSFVQFARYADEFNPDGYAWWD